jgi:hypothetical protein
MLAAMCWLAPLAIADEPADWAAARPIAPGIEHQCRTLATPRPLVVNVVRVDARAPGVGFHATRRTDPWEDGKAETRRQTVRGFLDESRRRGLRTAEPDEQAAPAAVLTRRAETILLSNGMPLHGC